MHSPSLSVFARVSLALLTVAAGFLTPDAARAQFPTRLGPPKGSPTQSRYPGMGLLPSTPAQFAAHPHFRIAAAQRGERPSQLLLTQYLPPVGDQGAQGSCVAWSCAYYNYTYALALQRRLTPDQLKDPKWQFSPAFIYNQAHGPQGGMSLGAAFAVLKAQGCASLAEMPYNDSDDSTPPSSQAVTRAAKYAARMVGCVFQGPNPDPEKLKTFLAEVRQPFTTAIPVYKDFPHGHMDPDFVYALTLPDTPDNVVGHHALTIIGYDDAKHAFRVVNSWGPNWGDNGFLWISEGFLTAHSFEGWADAPGGPFTRNPLAAAGTRPRDVTLVAPTRRFR